ncbi:hypothetical protein GCM10027590_24400 [Nocardiopsis nanhaiensis]
MIIDRTVTLRVIHTPRTTGSENMWSNMKDQLNAGFVKSMCTNIAARTRMTPAATHRSGYRTGTAVIGAAERPGVGSFDPGPPTGSLGEVTVRLSLGVSGGSGRAYSSTSGFTSEVSRAPVSMLHSVSTSS